MSLCKRRHAEARITAVLKQAPEEVEVPTRPFPVRPTSPCRPRPSVPTRSAPLTSTAGSAACRTSRPATRWVDSPEGFHYRNKMEYSFSAIGREPGDDPDAEFADGFSWASRPAAPGGRWRTSGATAACSTPPSRTCSPTSDAGVPTATPWHAPKRGFFRFLVVRRSLSEDRLLVNLVTTSDGLDEFDAKGFHTLLVDRLEVGWPGSSTPSTTTRANGWRPGMAAPISWRAKTMWWSTCTDWPFRSACAASSRPIRVAPTSVRPGDGLCPRRAPAGSGGADPVTMDLLRHGNHRPVARTSAVPAPRWWAWTSLRRPSPMPRKAPNAMA